jgi:hypothetical protein
VQNDIARILKLQLDLMADMPGLAGFLRWLMLQPPHLKAKMPALKA